MGAPRIKRPGPPGRVAANTLFPQAAIARRMGLVGRIVSIAVFVVVVAAALGGFLYLRDAAVTATITDKGSDADGAYVVVTPRLYPTDIKQYVDANAADFVCVGYQVEYHVRSGHYLVYDQNGGLVYDSNDGLVNAGEALRCLASGGIP